MTEKLLFEVEVDSLMAFNEKTPKCCEVEKTEFACVPDCKIFKTFRDKPAVKSVKTDDKIGGVNESAWFFKDEDLFYNLPKDKISSSITGKNANYLRVLPCEKGQSHKLELCDKNGKVFTKTEKEVEIKLTKCNLLGDIELNDYVREDWLQSLIIKPSTSKEFGEFIGKESRAEVYTYDPMNKEVGDKVAKLNATILEKGKIHSYLLDDGSSYSQDAKDDRVFPIASQEIVVQKNENGSYVVKTPVMD